jgi:AcrR family transcriptional regulator
VVSKRFLNLPDTRRGEILSVAADVFAEHGYDGTSYNLLLSRLGLGKSQAYYYFTDKADLFLTACSTVYDAYYSEVAQLPLPTSAVAYWRYVEQLHLIGFRYQQAHPLAARLTLALANSSARAELTRAAMDGGTSHSQTAAWIALGQGLGAVRSDLPADLLLTLCVQTSSLLDAWFAGRALTATQAEQTRWAAQFTDLSRRMLAPRPTRNSSAQPRKKGS